MNPSASLRPCLCWSPTCHYCAGQEHCTHCNPGNPATDEQMAARWGMSEQAVRDARESLIRLIRFPFDLSTT